LHVTTASIRHPVSRIGVRLVVGAHLLSGSDDPLYLGLCGPAGREFRLAPERGSALRRGHEDYFVLGASDDKQTNVAHAELNDPTHPPMDAESITGVYLRKGLEPIPNVRGLGEMDDRLELDEVEVEIHADGRAHALRFLRTGPLWLGLVCGLQLEIPFVDEGA
jgi:hypothetical protein